MTKTDDQNIYAAIKSVMLDIGPISKDRKNTQQNYAFRGIDDLMNAISPLLAKHGIIPTIEKIETIDSNTVLSSAKKEGYRIVNRYTFRFFAQDGSFVTTTADGEAIDYGDKASNKAYSVAYREAMFKMFVIPFESDDIENHTHDLKPVEKMAPYTARREVKTAEAEHVQGEIESVQKEQIKDLLATLNRPVRGQKAAADAVFDLVGLPLRPDTFAEVIEALKEKLDNTDPLSLVLKDEVDRG